MFSARKPLSRAFKTVARQMGLKKRRNFSCRGPIVDRCPWSNIAGFYTVLVVPVVHTDGRITKINRMIERKILKRMQTKSNSNKEE